MIRRTPGPRRPSRPRAPIAKGRSPLQAVHATYALDLTAPDRWPSQRHLTLHCSQSVPTLKPHSWLGRPRFGFLSRIGGLCALQALAQRHEDDLPHVLEERVRSFRAEAPPIERQEAASLPLEVENSYSAELVVEVDRLMRKPTTPTAARTASTRMSFFMPGACHGVYGPCKSAVSGALMNSRWRVPPRPIGSSSRAGRPSQDSPLSPP